MSENLKRAVLLDSSAILALLDSDDQHHRRAVETAKALGDEKRPVFITNYLQAEAHALLLHRLGRGVARDWLLGSGLTVIRNSADDESRAQELIAEYDDKDWSLCDALSFATIERRRAAGAFSFDHHFLQHGRFRVWGIKR